MASDKVVTQFNKETNQLELAKIGGFDPNSEEGAHAIKDRLNTILNSLSEDDKDFMDEFISYLVALTE